LSATHIAKILKVSRSWLFTTKKQFSEGAPKDFKEAEQLRTLVKVHRTDAIEPLEGKVSPRSMQDHTQETEPRVSRIVKGRLLRMVDDCPAALLGRTAVLRGFSGEAYLPNGRDGAKKEILQTTENL